MKIRFAGKNGGHMIDGVEVKSASSVYDVLDDDGFQNKVEVPSDEKNVNSFIMAELSKLSKPVTI